MSYEELECCSTMETAVDVASFWEQLSGAELMVLVDTLNSLKASAEMPVEPHFSDLQLTKESDGNERSRVSGNEGTYFESLKSNSPGVMGELQPITDDQSLFSEHTQNNLYPMEDSHNHQLFQSHMSEVNYTQTFCPNLDPSPAAQLSSFELYHPVETLPADYWVTTSYPDVEGGGSPDEGAEPTSGSPDLVIILGSDPGSLASPPNGFAVSPPRSSFDSCRLGSHYSMKTVTNQANSPSEVNQIQMVKTEFGEDQWSASEVGEEKFDVRKERRRQQNRTAARRCRNRKKQTFEHMLKDAQKTKLENVELQQTIVRLREELGNVMRLVKQHQTHCGLQLTLPQLRNLASASPR